jgi:hypothetical protein
VKRAIAEQIKVMNEQQQVSDNLALIEIDIESAIMTNDFVTARRELAQLVEKAPDHPRRAFLEASIDRAEALAKLSPDSVKKEQAARRLRCHSAGERSTSKPRSERAADRAPSRSQRALRNALCPHARSAMLHAATRVRHTHR